VKRRVCERSAVEDRLRSRRGSRSLSRRRSRLLGLIRRGLGRVRHR
jgi:hypothetical protein